MNKTLAWIKERTAALRNWWDEHEVQIFQKRIDDFFERLGRNIARLVVIGILLNIISAYFWPELPERIPTIYSWFDGWLQFGEFAVKNAIKMLYSLFTGSFGEFWAGYQQEWNELVKQFVTWLSQL